MSRLFRRENLLLTLLLGLSAIVVASSFYVSLLAEHGHTRDIPVAVFGVVVGALGLIIAYMLFNIATAWMRRRTINRIVVGQIATVVRQNLPLATGLALAGESERGWARLHLKRIARLAGQGAPLSQALQVGYPDCPAMVLALVVAGEQAGQLPAALDQAEQYLIEETRRKTEVDVSAWPYVLIVLTFTLTVVSGIMVAVVPKFKEIFKDFGANLPRLTVLLIEVSEFVATWAVFMCLAVAAIPLIIYLSIRPRRYPEPRLTSRIADWIRWHMPGCHRMEFASGLAGMLGVMRLAVRSGMDLPRAARVAAGLDVNVAMRPRMLRFADLLTGGRPVREAAREAGLGEVAAVALASGQRSGDMDAALRYATDYHAAFLSRSWVLLRNLTWPAYTLLIGCVVAFVVVSLFLPLVQLINAVMGG
jgi:type II secretory pathway component PulF